MLDEGPFDLAGPTLDGNLDGVDEWIIGMSQVGELPAPWFCDYGQAIFTAAYNSQVSP